MNILVNILRCTDSVAVTLPTMCFGAVAGHKIGKYLMPDSKQHTLAAGVGAVAIGLLLLSQLGSAPLHAYIKGALIVGSAIAGSAAAALKSDYPNALLNNSQALEIGSIAGTIIGAIGSSIVNRVFGYCVGALSGFSCASIIKNKYF